MGLFSACLPGTAAVTPMAALAPASSEALPDASAQNADLLMVYLSPSQKKEMREAFLRFDVDGSGAIDGQELKTVMESMGFPVSDEQAQAIISSLDLDGNNKVEWGEFASLMAERWLRRDGAADLEMALKVLSGAEEGSVDVDRMRKLMTTVGETPFSSSEWDDLMKMVDPTGTGSVNRDALASLPCWEVPKALLDSTKPAGKTSTKASPRVTPTAGAQPAS